MSKILEINSLVKTFNKGKVVALNNVSFSLEKGEILSIIGESGSGKTTLIRLITGLETPDSGEVKIQQKLVSSATNFVVPEKRNVGLLFQDYALFPHLTVFDNVSYGVSKNENAKDRVAEVLKIVDLVGYEKRYPHELSGGQQQRVALARALAPNPELLILDEPFSNLDVVLRNQLRKQVSEILNKTNKTAIFITHDIKDAIEVSNKIIVLQNGNIVQEGTVKELYSNPINEYVKLLFQEQTTSFE